MKKLFNYFLMLTIALVGVVSLSSCGSDSEDGPEILYDDYYLSIKVSGGGLNAQELENFENSLNSELSNTDDLYGVTKEEAIAEFDQQVYVLKSAFANGMEGLKENLILTLYLKTTSGKDIKSMRITISDKNCTIG